MRKPHFLLALMASVLMSCTDAAPEPNSEEPGQSTTATTSTTMPATSTTTSVDPASSTTHPTQPESMWPADPPGRYALFEGTTLTVVNGSEQHEIADIADTPTAAGFVGDTLVFSVGCCDGVWAWDYADSDVADPLVEGGDDPVILQGVAPDWEQPGFFYTEGDNHRGEDLMFYDLGGGETRRFLEPSERHADLTEEELNATLGSAVATEEQVGLLVAFGDSTWVEWYTETGQPTDPPFEGIDQGDTVLELAIAPGNELLAIGREQQLHQGITTVEVVTATGDVRSYSVPDEQSLRDLQFDGRYVTASVHSTDPSADSEGSNQRVILDAEQNHFSYSPGPPILAVSDSEQTTGNAPVDGSDAQAQSLIESFITFSQSRANDDFIELPLADTVDLGLGTSIVKTVERDQLRQPDTWLLDVELFRAYVGPFSALDILRDLDGFETTIGEHPHCVSPPVRPPNGYETHERISVQPRLSGQDSCLSWTTVDFFLENDGDVKAITLDMYEP